MSSARSRQLTAPPATAAGQPASRPPAAAQPKPGQQTAGQPAARQPAAGQPAARRPPPRVPWLTFSAPLTPGQGWAAVHEVLARTRAAEGPVRVVILDLAGCDGLDTGDCAALGWLHGGLAARKARLWLAGVGLPLREPLGVAGLTELFGRGGLHPSLRAAVLAACALLPGPGLITPELRDALTAPAEPLAVTAGPAEAAGQAGETADPAGPDARRGEATGGLHPPGVRQGRRRGWWTVLARFRMRGRTSWLI